MTTTTAARLLAALCATTLALSAAACGDEDNNGSQDDGSQANADQTTAATTAAEEEPATDEGQIKALIKASDQAFKTGDGKTICDALTPAGQRDIVAYGSVMGLAGDCEQVAKGIVKQNQASDTEQPPVRIVAVRVRGPKATAVLRIPGAGPINQRYTKTNGQWKITSYKLAKAVGAPANQQ